MKVRKQHILTVVAIIVIIGIIAALQFPQQTQTSSQTGVIQPTQQTNVGLNIGQQAPDFVLEDFDGKAVKLSDFKNKSAVFVNFWASWCPFCVDEIPDIENAGQKYSDKVTVLFINRGENADRARSYIREQILPQINLKSPLLFDPDEKVSRVYILFGMPVSYFIDKNGIIVDRKFGPLSAEEINQKVARLAAL